MPRDDLLSVCRALGLRDANIVLAARRARKMRSALRILTAATLSYRGEELPCSTAVADAVTAKLRELKQTLAAASSELSKAQSRATGPPQGTTYDPIALQDTPS